MENIPQIRTLLVEDYPPNILMLEILLEEWGHNFVVVRNGADAVKHATEKHYDIILMDVNMPVMNGYDATKIIREHEKQRHKTKSFILGMTANAMIGDMAKCLNAGMDDYVSKPFNITELEARLRSLRLAA